MMESACLRHTEIPHTSALFSHFQYHFDKVAGFYAHNPHQGASYAAAAKQIDYPDDRRAALVSALRLTNRETAALDRLAQPGTLAVVTGQQVGLFSGPAYTVYKALTAIRLAEHLSALGIPAAPIFWLATEDHDVAEVNHTFVFGPDQRPVQLSANSAGAGDQPVGSIAIPQPPLSQLRQILKAFPYGEEVFEMVNAAYRPGVSFGKGFRALLEHLFAGRGLIFVDPLNENVRRLAAPILQEAVRRDEDLHAKLIERGRLLESEGYHAQVHVEPKTSLVFLLDQAHRVRLRRQNGEYTSKGNSGEHKFSAAELIDRAEHLSPNALLRPVVQDYMLPTLAYVGGPAELAYMAQSQVVYRELLGRMPVMVSRGGFTVLDGRTAKLMDRYGLNLQAVLHGEEHVREAIARKLIPPALADQFNAVHDTISTSVDRLRNDLAAFDPTLAAAANKSLAKVTYQLSKIERKAERETLRRNERAASDAALISGLILPNNHLQERQYSILPFLARHGVNDLMDTLYDHLRLECPDHQVLVI